MSNGLQETMGRVGRAGPGREAQQVRWLGALALGAFLLGLAALDAELPAERAAPSVATSATNGVQDRPIFDGRGKWTGY